MNAEMDTRFTSSLRSALIEHASKEPRRRRARVFGVVAAMLALPAAGGIAYAAGVLLPGQPVVSTYGDPVAGEYTGSVTIELGDRPDGATQVSIEFRCLTAGSFTFADGARILCSDDDARRNASGSSLVTSYEVDLEAGATSTAVTVRPADARWSAVSQYASSRASSWGTNANGQTFGVQNDAGLPDLVAVWASNGQSGYAYATELFPEDGQYVSATIPVYESDGQTVIGSYDIEVAATGDIEPIG